MAGSLAGRFLPFTLALLTLTPGAAQAGDKHPVEFAKPRPDKALVYFIRTGRLSGGADSMYMYADKTFLGVMDNGTYGYAYVEPGHHLFWVVWGYATRELDVVPGETYYFNVWKDISVVDEMAGQALIEKVADLVTPTAREIKKSEKHIRDRFSDAVDYEAEKEKVAVEEVAAAPPPDNTEGMLKVPAYTPVNLDLLETVTSEFSPAGTRVLFQVAEDAAVGGQVFVTRGTRVEGIVREADQAGAFGKAGSLDVVLPSLTAVDGSKLPLVAQLASAGKGREDTAAYLQLGVLPALAVRGREAFHFAGEPVKVWTRGDTWVKPQSDAPAEGAPAAEPPAAAEPQSAAAGTAPLILPARCPGRVNFNPRKGYVPDDLKIVLADPTEPKVAEVVVVGPLALPTPVKAARVVRSGDGWECVFDGWSVVRYLRPGSGDKSPKVELRGMLADGRSFSAQVPIDYSVER